MFIPRRLIWNAYATTAQTSIAMAALSTPVNCSQRVKCNLLGHGGVPLPLGARQDHLRLQQHRLQQHPLTPQSFHAGLQNSLCCLLAGCDVMCAVYQQLWLHNGNQAAGLRGKQDRRACVRVCARVCVSVCALGGTGAVCNVANAIYVAQYREQFRAGLGICLVTGTAQRLKASGTMHEMPSMT